MYDITSHAYGSNATSSGVSVSAIPTLYPSIIASYRGRSIVIDSRSRSLWSTQAAIDQIISPRSEKIYQGMIVSRSIGAMTCVVHVLKRILFTFVSWWYIRFGIVFTDRTYKSTIQRLVRAKFTSDSAWDRLSWSSHNSHALSRSANRFERLWKPSIVSWKSFTLSHPR